MPSKKKTAKKSATQSKSGKTSGRVKPSMKKGKVSKGLSKKTSRKAAKPKASKKVSSKSTSKGSGSFPKKTKASTPSKKTKSASPNKTTKKAVSSAAKKRSQVSVDAILSSQDRYNAGGLCACVIDTSTSAGEAKLRRVLTYWQLSEMDQANLYRVSQGVRIPKLFADGFGQADVRNTILQSLERFAKADDPTEKKWKTELEALRRLLAN